MTMLWTSSREWAPSLLVAVQSHPRYLIEIWLYCIVAVVLAVAVLIRSRATRALDFPLLLDVTNHGSGPESLSSLLEGEATLDDAGRLSAGDAGAGDAAGADPRPRHWAREALVAAAPAAASLQMDIHAAACAACQRAHGAQQSGDAVPMASSDASPAEEDEDVVVEDLDGDDDDMLSVDDSTLTLGEGQSSEAVQQECEEEDAEQAGAPRGTMVEYVSARYQSFKKAALAEKLFAADPDTSTSTLLEKDLVAILSLALSRRAGAHTATI